MKATVICTQGADLEATIEITGQRLRVMDSFSSYDRRTPPGTCIDITLSSLSFSDETWEQIFTGNPDKLKRLESLGGWRYRAYGQVRSIDPMVVDCGVDIADDVVSTHDPRVVGEYVAYTIDRLDAM
ncbi:MAG: hypothetical protein KGY81_02550 [Phycisphaerae bacterium]|nr:hypothetical protein [Phycisphaerae bacterium]